MVWSRWIATRSSGQQSLGYGRIEDLFAGGYDTGEDGVKVKQELARLFAADGKV